MVIPLSVEPNTFRQIIELPPKVMLELIETVSLAATINSELTMTPDNKITIACTMLANANTMLEQCGCEIETRIKNKTWINDATYKTENGETKQNE